MNTILSLNQLARLTLLMSAYISLVACKHEIQTETPVPLVVAPILQPYPKSDHAPIDSVYGTYQANWYRETSSSSQINYPINGQTVSLTIKPVAGDTVQVAIQATANGKYSPGKNLSYPKAVVVSNIHTDGTVIYYVYLNQPTNQDCGGFNTLYVYYNHTIDYNFIQPGNNPCLGISGNIRLARK